MIGRTKRKIYATGSSRVITLPPEWLENLDHKEVDVIFDKNLLVVIPDSQLAEKIAEDFIKRAIDLAVS